MNKLSIISLVIFLLFSCKENEADNAVENAQSKVSYTRYSKGKTMLDAIYLEQIKNDENLKAIDNRINMLYEDSQKIKNINQEITDKSTEYYLDATSAAKRIIDSSLRKQTIEMVNESIARYHLKQKKLNDLQVKMNYNNQLVYSEYNSFKIRKTLPEIEKYQNAHPLKTDSLEKFIEKQKQLLRKLKSLK
ncbi:hypothetical protein [Chryseobacterium echinoideorum]|uniref:hypothetical protein n=1 Tax=Chryseobacterium echinoideorum TaxID=1549648 RepID=UPI001186F532|nr:hypothetical protein [Chryseobacterium echinoideorum]